MSNIAHSAVKVVDNDAGIAEITVDNNLQTMEMSQLVPEVYDYVEIGYVPAELNGEGEIQTVNYKIDGESGTTVAVLLLEYDVLDRLIKITRSS